MVAVPDVPIIIVLGVGLDTLSLSDGTILIKGVSPLTLYVEDSKSITPSYTSGYLLVVFVLLGYVLVSF
jgi:hypothetical protein